MSDFQTADKLLTEGGMLWTQLPDWHSPTNDPKHRLLVSAIPEAIKFRRDVCNQTCGTHLYFKNGIPYEQETGEQHDCRITRIVKMFKAHFNEIPIYKIRDILLAMQIDIPPRVFDTLMNVLDSEEKKNKPWAIAWDGWKSSNGKIIPRSKDVESQ